jgi:3-hydroxy acid dehydrogenase/malonic semialdehyde reductase
MTPRAPSGGRTLLVTGAAGGIGRAVVQRRIECGDRVLLLDRDADGLRRMEREYGERRVAALVADLSSDRIADALEHFVAGHPLFEGAAFDGLVHAAGIGGWVAFERLDVLHWNELMNTNVRGAVMATRAMLPRLRAGSTVVALSSDSALRPFPGRAAYCASKAALGMAMDVLREEVRAAGVRVSTLFFNRVDTGFNAGKTGSRPEALQPDDLAAVIDTVLSLRPGAELRELVLAGQQSPFGA